jgi:hypothetical protein
MGQERRVRETDDVRAADTFACRTASPAASLGTVMVTSRTTLCLPTECVSTALTMPPASPIAEARRPNAPGEFGVSIRTMREVPIAGASMILLFLVKHSGVRPSIQCRSSSRHFI